MKQALIFTLGVLLGGGGTWWVVARTALDATAVVSPVSSSEVSPEPITRIVATEPLRPSSASAVDVQGVASTDEVAEVETPNASTDDTQLKTLEEEDPAGFERYQAEVKRRSEMLQQMVAARHDFLTTVDTELLTGDQQLKHQAFVDALAYRDDIFAQISAYSSEGKEIPAELLRERRKAMSALQRGVDEERNILLQATGRSLGLDEADSIQFVELIKTILAVTDYKYATQQNAHQLLK